MRELWSRMTRPQIGLEGVDGMRRDLKPVADELLQDVHKKRDGINTSDVHASDRFDIYINQFANQLVARAEDHMNRYYSNKVREYLTSLQVHKATRRSEELFQRMRQEADKTGDALFSTNTVLSEHERNTREALRGVAQAFHEAFSRWVKTGKP
jgi:hypothetical protein